MTPRLVVEFHPRAVEEAEAAERWYRERSEGAAARFRDELERAVASISETPDRWPSFVAGTRRFLFQRYPFSIVYRERPGKLQVIAVAHGRRRPGYWRRR